MYKVTRKSRKKREPPHIYPPEMPWDYPETLAEAQNSLLARYLYFALITVGFTPKSPDSPGFDYYVGMVM